MARPLVILALLLRCSAHALQFSARGLLHFPTGNPSLHEIRCGAPSTLSFASPAWEKLQRHLDELPAFTCVNENSEPLGYERDGRPIAIFFADVDRAEQELTLSREKFPDLGLRLMSVGLGDVFRRTVEGEALLVPSQTALAAAGEDWNSETLPLYVCLAMSKPATDGSGEQTTPFFMEPADAQASLDAAIKATEQSGGLSQEMRAQLQLSVTSLNTAVDLVLAGKEKETCGDDGGFQFVAPRRSAAYLQAAMQELQRRASAPPSAQGPTARRAAATEQTTPGLFPE
jgi:hypothetical protein